MKGSSVMAVIEEEPARTPTRSLRREIGLISLLWASMGSIIGSGWLFGAKTALATCSARGRFSRLRPIAPSWRVAKTALRQNHAH